MDITPIYELRARLRAAAIAGTGLMTEDFRLKRAVEAVQPLEAAAPVFAKIGQMARSLFTAEKEEREGILLDVLTLTDAVLCTQGAVAAAGEMEPIPVTAKGRLVNNASYSELRAVLDALTHSGDGRYGYLKEVRQTRPEIFDDYRVVPAMVQALGASYSELADDVEGWLKEKDISILPLLQKDFDPKGKKEMVRRVRVLDALAGADANAFYLEQYPDAEKEVRQALIFALRHCPENKDVLLSLVKTEKGNTKKMAYCALACLEDEEAKGVILALLEKKPEDAIAALSLSGAGWAAQLVRDGIFGEIEKFEKRIADGEFKFGKARTPVDFSLLNRYMEALQGKEPDVVCDCIRRLARFAANPAFGRIELSFVQYQVTMNKGQTAITMSMLLGSWLTHYVAVRPDKEVLDLIQGIYEEYRKTDCGEDYFAAALLARLVSEEDCSAWLLEDMKKNKKSAQSAKLSVILNTLRYDETRQKWVLQKWNYSPAFDNRVAHTVELMQQVRGDFLQILMDDGYLVGVLGNCIPNGDAQYEQKLMDYFYRQALRGNSVYYCLTQLKNHNYPKCEGLAVQQVKRKSQLSMWELKSLLGTLPGSSEVRRAEGREVLKLVKKNILGKSKVVNLNMEELEIFVETL